MWNNLRIRTKMLLLSLFTIAMILLITLISINNQIVINRKALNSLEQTIRQDYDTNIKNQVENVITLLHGINKRYEARELTLEQAKKLSADLIRNLRYNDTGYFWIDAADGTNIVLLVSDTEGTNRYNLQDTKGDFIVQKAIKIAINEGGGYFDYYFPKSGETQSLPKRGYSKYFEPFNWVVGTGNYIDDIDKVIAERKAMQSRELNEIIITFIILFIIFILIAFVMSVVISKNITIPIEAAVSHAKKITNGVLTVEVPDAFKLRKDEVGHLLNSFEIMQNSIKELLESVEEKTKIIEKEKELFRTTLISVGDGVIVTDNIGKVTLLNDVAETLTGWSKKDAFGKQFKDIFKIINDKTKKIANNPVREVLDKGKVVELEENTILISKQGDEVHIDDSAAPIKDKEGNIIGAVVVFRDITEKKKKQESIEYLSFHDQLTGLYNRRFFEEEVIKLDIEKNYPLSFVVADVNGLKLANDAFGHLVGDKLIQKFGEILKEHTRTSDIIARIGGDEFVILLPRTTSKESEIIIERIRKASSLEKIKAIKLSVSFGYETKYDSNYPMSEMFKKAERNMYDMKLAESQKIKENVIDVIIDNIHEKCQGYKERYNRISKSCELIGNKMGVVVENMKDLQKAALLHDIGNITLNDAILEKKGKLTDLEWIEVKRHAEAGYHILRSIDKMANVSEYILAHHERWDGKGYPRGLKGDEIPLEARIISVADAYNAMRCDRPFKKALSKNEAIEEIKKNKGTQFDPKVVKAFLEVCKEVN